MSGDRAATSGQVETIVVGAGIAGLAAARHLVAARRSVVVLEATDRIGGRLRSTDVATGGRVDLGATWFWPGERRVVELVAELGVRTHHQHVAGDAMFDAPGTATRIDGNPIDVTSFRFADGADSLTEALAASLPAGTIRLSHPVNRIVAGTSDLVVHAGAGRHRGRTVVLALAPAASVAQIEFVPPLPGRIAALARSTPIWMGSMTKVVVVYPEAFWRADGLAGAAVSHRGPLREIHDMSGPAGVPAAIFGFVPSGGTVERGAVIEQLARLFGARATEPIEIHVADWAAEKRIVPVGVEPSTAYELFGHPVYREPLFDRRVVWASTETGTVSSGHIEGALEAAEHAARTLLRTLDRPSVPTSGGPT